MKRKTFNALYDIRKILVNLYMEDENKQTRRELNRLIKSLTRILTKNY